MNEFKQKLEETLNRLYKQNKLSIDAYSELIEFAYPNQSLQLQQTGVIKSVCEIEKEFEGCPLFKQYDNGCYGCKYRKQTEL